MKLLDHAALDQMPSRPVREVAAVCEAQAEALLGRARHLLPEDRLLLVAALELRLSLRRLSELLGRPLGSVSRRLRELERLLTDPFLVQVLDGRVPLEPENRAILVGYFLHGRTFKQLAADHDLTANQIARRIEYFRGWMKGAEEKGRRMKAEG